MTDVVLDGVDKVYPGGQVAVRNVRLRINEGELFVLLGPSGCGKSTILRMIAGLEEITAGDLWLNGSVANDLPPRERNVAMVFQEGALYPHRTVRGNMMFPLEVSGDDRAEAGAKVVELARALGINTMIDRLPGTLSGGQRQRAAIGRALIREPQLYLVTGVQTCRCRAWTRGCAPSCGSRSPGWCAPPAPPPCTSPTTRSRP